MHVHVRTAESKPRNILNSMKGDRMYFKVCSHTLHPQTVEFFDSGRPHMQQELLEPDEDLYSVSTTSFIWIPRTVLKAW